MSSYTLKNKQDVEDFIRGVTFMGTGGGGDPKLGLDFLVKALEEGYKLSWVDISEINEEEWVAMPFYMGSIAPISEENLKKLKEMGLGEPTVERPLIKAVQELEKYKQIKLGALIAGELGGSNTPAPLDTAARLNKVFIDGDFAGRAIPELTQATPCVKNKSICPLVMCDLWGNVNIIESAINFGMVEEYGRSIVMVTNQMTGNIGFLMKVKELKEVMIPGTLTDSYVVGKTIREAREAAGHDPVEKVVEVIGGHLLFKGTVIEREFEDKKGFMFGTHVFEGLDEFQGHTFKIWFKNENHITWLDNKPYVCSPDIITVVALGDCEPITNTYLKVRQQVAVIGKSHIKYRDKGDVNLLTPKHFGFDIEWKPMEQVL
ncbi:hypothetical protein ES705_39387 [subsurface metagenome]|jgi:hypothetical protein|nr:MAG: DUF917 domain-containing protein [Candidatus Atribacteria bacterium 1244-E10-H5-B2]